MNTINCVSWMSVIAAAIWPSVAAGLASEPPEPVANVLSSTLVVMEQPDELRVLDQNAVPDGPAKMLNRFLLTEAQEQFDIRRIAIEAVKTPGEVEHRQRELKDKFVASLGGFPEKTPLNPRIVGQLQGDGFRVEKVLYESRPDHHVTAVLYLPNGEPPFPGVLVPCGHSANGKANEAYQRISILLAKNGLAALCYDPIGQGERSQLLDEAGKPRVPGSTTEHSLAGIGALLVGWQTASYRIWDGIRSLDYLASRPEINPTRLGCTGNSGGGTLTAYLMALDERIVAAAPSCYITSLERLFSTIGPQDAEQNITGQVAFGMEHADYITMRAPRPTLLCIGTQDYFDYRGAWTTFREAKLLYGLMGHGERVDLFEFNDKHGFSQPRREAAMRWMRRWLLGKDDAPTEQESPIFKDEELQCTKSGQVLADLRGKSVFDLNGERESQLERDRKLSGSSQSKEDRLRSIRSLIALPESIPTAERENLNVIRRDGYDIRKILFRTEPGIALPALWFGPHVESKPQGILVLYLNGDGKTADSAPGGAIEELCRAGYEVLAVDLRGMGETSPGKPPEGSPNYLGTDTKEAFLALHLNRPLLGQRVLDTLSVLQAVRGEWRQPVHIIGSGTAGPIALHAATFDSRIEQTTIEKSTTSWSTVVRTPLSHNQLSNAVPGALTKYDLPDLITLIAPREVKVKP